MMLKTVGSKLSSAKMAIGAGITALTLSATNAMAELSVAQLAVTDSIDLLITDLSAWAWTAVLAIVGVFVGIKLLKKFVFKSV